MCARRSLTMVLKLLVHACPGGWFPLLVNAYPGLYWRYSYMHIWVNMGCMSGWIWVKGILTSAILCHSQWPWPWLNVAKSMESKSFHIYFVQLLLECDYLCGREYKLCWYGRSDGLGIFFFFLHLFLIWLVWGRGGGLKRTCFSICQTKGIWHQLKENFDVSVFGREGQGEYTVGPREPWLDLCSKTGRFGEL